MPSSVDSPVQTRLPFPVPDGVLGGGRGTSRPVGRRRIFVQTDTGSVLGIELDRADNVQTVKKKMQTMLNVPTEQTALVFGDTVFKGDLSELRNDSPLLLTRELQRSLSTPCIYPLADVQVPAEGGQPFEVVGGLRGCQKMKRIIKDIIKGIACGMEPVAASGGMGGAYYFRNSYGESVAIVKPTDEEPFAPNNPKGFVGRSLGQPGLKMAVRVGETGVREVAAYLLDHENFAKVPPTVLVKVSHHAFHVNSATTSPKGVDKACVPLAKIASCQQFVHHDYDASDHGTSRFSVAAVHRIGILDTRIFNTDRHAGNILVRNVKPLDSSRTWSCSNVHVNESLELIPIDHGLCLPEALEDPYFEWLHWPQASLPFSEEELDYIERLDGFKDVEMLRRELPMLREACFRMLILSTTLLKQAAAAGFCLAEIGELMSRDGLEEASEFELLCMQAKLMIDKEHSAVKLCDGDEDNDDALSEISVEHEQFEFEMDFEDDYRVHATDDGAQLWSRSDCNQSPVHRFAANFGLPFLPFSAETPHPCHRPLQVLQEVSQVEERGELSSPVFKMSSGRSTPSDRLPDTRSQKMKMGHVEVNPRWRQAFSPLLEEEEVVAFPEINSLAFCKNDPGSPRAMSYRSVSFSNRKQRYTDYMDRKAPASEITGKANPERGSPPVTLGDMDEEEWACFMVHFTQLLGEAIATKRDQSASRRQRLGISCQF